MNRIWPWLAALVILLVIGGAYLISVTPFRADQEQVVRRVVDEFGLQLKDVSLMAPKEDVADAMNDNYGAFVVPELLAEWENDPLNAPGRLTSSPWPERIEIRAIQKESDTRYVVEGDIVEVTNEGGGTGEEPTEAARRPIVLGVERRGGEWKIVMVKIEPYAGDGQWLLSSPNSQGVRFMYPLELPTTYISAVEWPPLVERTVNEYSCTPGPITDADGPLKTQERRVIGDREYCVTSSAEGAAGSTYRAYEYAFQFGNATYRVVFQLRYPQCLNYDEPQRGACTREQANYDVDALIDRIAQSIQTS
jgi:hypothetical protein